MLTLRFESDARGSGGAISYVTSAKAFRAIEKPGCIDVMIANENGVEIAHPIAGCLGSYDRLYVMNEAGQTVAKYTAPLPGCTGPQSEAA